MRILIAEDKRSFALHIGRALEIEGHTVTLAPDGSEALRLGSTAGFDLILLDVMLPRLDGFEVIRRIRNGRLPTQTILVSARDSMQDIVEGLDAGADDYLTKPFALDVLLAKVRAAQRRIPQAPAVTLRLSDLELRLESFEMQRGDRTLVLTRTECALLETLMRRSPGIVPHSVLLEQAWGMDANVSFDSLYVFIRALRSKITHGGEPELLHTVRGVGYCLRAES
ncbi:two component transcriptional regulator, winged helix family [Bryocella elongata]|uniref:Two component transcriptional regulator, winged helix family n=1 Tax=Bryocella elongata TaxID=863522 RepID=A0A1H6CGI1_9BACT|nr:response regulator transcription factor [Bryocella elongata]SEG72119.1 two component transcriptional regulator, winged helix family [Bryocella elongata]